MSAALVLPAVVAGFAGGLTLAAVRAFADARRTCDYRPALALAAAALVALAAAVAVAALVDAP